MKKILSIALSITMALSSAAAVSAVDENAIVWSFTTNYTFETGKTYYYTDAISETSTGAENELTIVTVAGAASTDGLQAANKRIAIQNKNTSYITYTPKQNGTLIANAKGMDIRSGDTVLASNTSTNTPSDLEVGCEVGKTYKIITNATNYGGLYSLKYIPEAEGEFEKSFTSETKGEIPCRIKAPSDYAEKSYPLVIFLHGENRYGTDNSKQLFDCSALFKQLDGKAILAAPQTAAAWDMTKLNNCVDAIKTDYNTSKVIAAGFSVGADACYLLAAEGKADKIIPIASGKTLSSDDITQLKTIPLWIFSGYTDTDADITAARSNVNKLQTEKADVMYTEYPFADHNAVRRNAVSDTALADWILADSQPAKVVDLVLFSGQSNMAGRGDYGEATVCPPFAGYEYHSVKTPLSGGAAPASISPALSTVNEPFGKYENNSVMNDKSGNTYDRRNGDMVSSVMKAYYDKSGVPIVGVQASRGGETTTYFLGDSVMTEMTTRYKDAEEYLTAAGYTVRKKFMVWCQGCSDADEIIAGKRTLDIYKSNVQQIFNKITENTGISDIFVVRIGHRANNNNADAVYKTVNEAQAEIIEANNNLHEAGNLYTDDYKKLMRDNFHYYQPAYNSIGQTAGGNIAQYYIDNSAEYTVTFDYGNGNTVTRTVAEGGTVTEIPAPPSKDIIRLSDGHGTNGILVKATYKQDGTLDSAVTENQSVELDADQTEYALPVVAANEKYFLWNSLNDMQPLGEMKNITAKWAREGNVLSAATPITENITVTPMYEN